jgi:hypothetical protein
MNPGRHDNVAAHPYPTMSTKYEIPEGISREDLIEIHSELLATHYSVRVNYRWGDYTEYSVRLKPLEAATLMDREANPDYTWRLVVGLSEPAEEGTRDPTVDVQYHHPETKEWETACYDVQSDTMTVSAVHLWEAAADFIEAKHPVLAALVNIDARLLDDSW